MYEEESASFPRLFLVRNFYVFLFSHALDIKWCEIRAFVIKGVKFAQDRSFTLFTLTLCVDNNLLFLISAEGMFNARSNSANWFLPLLSQFFPRASRRLSSHWFETFTTLPFIITIPCSSQLILLGTAFRIKVSSVSARAYGKILLSTISSMFFIVWLFLDDYACSKFRNFL